MLYPATTEDPNRLYQQQNFQCTSINVTDHGPIYRCRSCGVAFIWPQPTPDQLARLYEQGDDPQYLSEEGGRTAAWNRVVKIFLGQGQGKTLLDIGCHTGVFLNVAQTWGWKPSGVEPNAWAANYAKQHYQLPVYQTLDSVPEQSFDAITLFDVIEHLSAPKHQLLQIHQRSKRSSILLLTTPDLGSPMAKFLGSRWYCIRQQHLFYFDRQSIGDILKRSGWQVQSVKTYQRIFTIGYWSDRMEHFIPVLGKSVRTIVRPIRQKHVSIPLGDEMVVAAQRV